MNRRRRVEQTVDDYAAEIAKRDERIKRLEAALKDAEDALESSNSDRDETISDLEAVLIDVKYWLYDGLVYNKPVTSPRSMLRKIERALDP